MSNRKNSFVSCLLLLSATAGFAQSKGLQTVSIPQGSSVKLLANSVNATSYQWMKDHTYITGANSDTYNVTSAGTYTVISFNAQGCASDTSDDVIVSVGPPTTLLTADLEIKKNAELRSVTINETFEYLIKVKNNGAGNATMIEVRDELPAELVFEQIIRPQLGIADYNHGTRTIAWNIDKLDNGEMTNLSIKVKAIASGIIRNTATVKANESDPNLKNNSATDSKSIAGIIIPNVFTPNGDGLNDTFEIPGLELYEANEFTVVNRWGGTVYDVKGYKNDWAATGLNEGTYFYLLKLKNAAGKWEVYKGYVTVLRNK